VIDQELLPLDCPLKLFRHDRRIMRVSTLGAAKPLSFEQVIDLIDKARGGPGAVEIAIKLSKRQEFLRFSITRCNPLHPWLLCSSRFRLLTAVVGILYDSVPEPA
jgi:hypothetical protein